MNALKAKDLEEMNQKRPKKDLLVLEHLEQKISPNLKNDISDELLASRPRVRVYVNTTRTKKGDTHAVFSVKLSNGKVILHAYYVELENCVIHVSEAIRLSVVNEDKKYVHAWVEGDLVGFSQVPCSVKGSFDHIASYNPFKGPNFYDVRTREDMESTPLDKAGKNFDHQADKVHMFGRCAHTRSK